MARKNNIKNDAIEDLLQSKFEDFSLDVSEDDWTIIERGMGSVERKAIPFYRYVSIAASIAIVAVMGFYLSKTGEQIIEPKINFVEQIEYNPVASPDNNSYSSAIEVVTNLKNVIERSKDIEIKLTSTVVDIVEPENSAVKPDKTIEAETSSLQSSSKQSEQTQKSVAKQQQATRNNRMMAAFDPYHDNNKKKSGDGWSLAMFANGKTKLNSSDSYSPNASLMMFNNKNGIVVYSNGMGMLNAKVEQTKFKHSIPLSFGLTVRKGLSKRWGVETGLVYSYLSSKSELNSTSNYKFSSHQQLHYLGVPIAFTYSIHKTKAIEFYARGGGQADFNIGAKLTTDFTNPGSDKVTSTNTEKFDINSVQFSASANVGVMYNISPRFGLYFEPGVGYYFKNDSQPDSYWQQHPTNFNMRLGFRTNF